CGNQDDLIRRDRQRCQEIHQWLSVVNH
ncbi:hypothetical protein TorRG33x02_016980, partial [Trema orientale]